MTAALESLRGLGNRVLVFGHMIRFSHSVFALPFALAGVLFAAHATGAFPSLRVWAWVVVAMVAARTAAMSWNRIADMRMDARNPRTRDRALPAGVLSVQTAWIFTLSAALLFVIACSQINRLALILSPVALAIVAFYSLTKRFTWASHFFLGLALAVAPVGGWVAVTGRLDAAPFVLALGVLAWVAGFDIFYALQDLEVDRSQGLFSLPARFDVDVAFQTARACHVLAFLALASLTWLLDLSFWYLIGVGAVALLLLYEHRLIHPQDLRRLDRAFFDLNAVISVVYLGASAAGVFL
ncbi:MAG TPA: UbiA-like polyprenyltransferase [Candidatus Eisenbacteria bacterium]|nr:UbiA-like polyprenyltransferase [Candidatus Eisenbacteria bacterium]